MTNKQTSFILYSMGRELVKKEQGVSIYKEDDNYTMYIEEQRIMTLHKNFKSMIDKSYDNLVNIRKKNSDKTE